MIVKRLALTAAAAALVVGAGAIVLDNLARGPGSPAAEDIATPGPGQQGETAASEGARDEVPGSGTARPDESDAGSGPAGAEEGSGAADQPVLEVLPPVNPAPTALPMPSPYTALVSAPLPAAASASMDVVEGFPTHILTFPDTTVVVFTGVSSSGNTLQATAEGIAALPVEMVSGHFQQILHSAGFRFDDVPGEGDAALRLTRGLDSVSISITTTGTGSTRFSLLGNFHTEPGF